MPQLKLIRLTLLAVIVTACLSNPTQTTETTNQVVCKAFTEISYSAKLDTEETVQQIRGHNAAYRALCK